MNVTKFVRTKIEEEFFQCIFSSKTNTDSSRTNRKKPKKGRYTFVILLNISNSDFAAKLLHCSTMGTIFQNFTLKSLQKV